MLRKVLKLSASPRVLLRSVLALDDAPHPIALGVAIGVFVGLTPTVGIQTVLILALVVLCRPFFYFNGSAAMAATYVSNPFTMVPLYYFWYRLGSWFVPGRISFEDFTAALQFDGLAGWWTTVCNLGVQVGVPTLIGGLLTAPFGVAIAYPAAYFLVKWARTPSRQPVAVADDDNDHDGHGQNDVRFERTDEGSSRVAGESGPLGQSGKLRSSAIIQGDKSRSLTVS
ncbi:MAG: DUF2062 domain-containing protein [Planctomycetaceae bacterium]